MINHDIQPDFLKILPTAISRAMKKGPKRLVREFVGDKILPRYMGITYVNHEIRIPFFNNQDSMESRLFVFFVAQLID